MNKNNTQQQRPGCMAMILSLLPLMLLSLAPVQAQHEMMEVPMDTCYHDHHHYNTKVFSRLGNMKHGRLDESSLPEPTSQFIIAFDADFPQQAREAMNYAVYLWSTVLVSDVAIRVNARWEPRGTGVLASAGPSLTHKNFSGALETDVLYPDALADAMAGKDLAPTRVSDINISFSSDIDWYLGTDLNTSGKFDFVTIALHELGHGLGFYSWAFYDKNSGMGDVMSQNPYVMVKDMSDINEVLLVNYTPYSTDLGAMLVSNAVYLAGPHGKAGNGGKNPKVFAPTSFMGGSSLSHLDESTYPAGSSGSLMSPRFGKGEAVHEISPMIRGILKDMGWTINDAVTTEPEPSPEPEPEPTPEPEPAPTDMLAPVTVNNPASGLQYSYYEGSWDLLPDFSQLSAVKSGKVANVDMSSRNQNDRFAYTFEGFFNAPADSEYTFYTTSDDGSKLYIHGQEVVNNDGTHAAQEGSGKIGLQQGLHPFKVTFFEKTGGETLEVRVQSDQISKRLIQDTDVFFDDDGSAEPSTHLLEPVTTNNTAFGLKYSYYQGTWNMLPDFSQLSALKSGTVANLDMSDRNRNDYFAYVFEGYFNAPADGNYTFSTTSDDGSKLYIHGQEVVNNDGLHGARERSGTIGLQQGLHPIKITFFEKTGEERLDVHVQSDQISKRLIQDTDVFFDDDGSAEPTVHLLEPVSLSNPASGLNYSYYEGSWDILPDFGQLTAQKSGTVANIDISSRNSNDKFAYVFEGYFSAPADGNYTFSTTSDDGSKLYIHGQEVVNNDGLHGARERSGTIGLQQGLHPIKITFFEKTGGETLQVSVSLDSFNKRLLSSEELFYESAVASSLVLDDVQVNIFPNPASDYIRVAFANFGTATDLFVYDSFGRLLIYEEDLMSGDQINVSDLKPGLYQIKLRSSEGQLHYGRLLKE